MTPPWDRPAVLIFLFCHLDHDDSGVFWGEFVYRYLGHIFFLKHLPSPLCICFSWTSFFFFYLFLYIPTPSGSRLSCRFGPINVRRVRTGRAFGCVQNRARLPRTTGGIDVHHHCHCHDLMPGLVHCDYSQHHWWSYRTGERVWLVIYTH